MISAAPSTRMTSQEFMTSLSRLPAPAGPSHLVSRPSAAYTGSSTGCAASGPEARISSWPFSAGPRVPDTGASTKYTSGRSWPTRAASSSLALTPIVLICDQTASGRIASSIPNSKATWFTAAASATMVITTSACRTASPGSSWAVAPSAASWAAGSGVRFHTSTVEARPEQAVRHAPAHRPGAQHRYPRPRPGRSGRAHVVIPSVVFVAEVAALHL